MLTLIMMPIQMGIQTLLELIKKMKLPLRTHQNLSLILVLKPQAKTQL